MSLCSADLLLLNNCPGHPSAEELCTDDGEISVMFLPPNTTALIQPMDQNVIQNVKLVYRKLLLANILNDPVHNENLEKTLTNVNLKDVQSTPLSISAHIAFINVVEKFASNLLIEIGRTACINYPFSN
ncbi:hypothetical protein AVEN_83401-1 [Araneus ventricosus]|uniref:DDE-1 domain-containing protein n=1 Tax=Araneus ventricosus TaxID=182803 RepID=A0A4Y2KNQ1_ARAVE|nr:hypothetical protein AVEN_83401-1 [Araneus ventricosus]